MWANRLSPVRFMNWKRYLIESALTVAVNLHWASEMIEGTSFSALPLAIAIASTAKAFPGSQSPATRASERASLFRMMLPPSGVEPVGVRRVRDFGFGSGGE